MAEKETQKIAFVGAGNMAEALFKSFIVYGAFPEGNIIIYGHSKERYAHFSNLKIIKAKTIAEIDKAKYIFLAVKPHQAAGALLEMKNARVNLASKTLVSICAGVPIDFIISTVGYDFPVIRMMPSTTLKAGAGAAALSKNALVSKKDFAFICRLVSAAGTVAVLDESLQNAVVALNASSPAYVFLFIKALLEGASDLGIPKESALPLALKTLEGATRLAASYPGDIECLIGEVATPGGTTEKALTALLEGGFVESIKSAMAACAKRADEITTGLTEKAGEPGAAETGKK